MIKLDMTGGDNMSMTERESRYASEYIKQSEYDLIKKTLKKDGYYILKQRYLDSNGLKDMKTQIDTHENENVEKNFNDSEIRIWDAQEKSTLFKQFYDDSTKWIDAITSKSTKAKTLLAIRNKSINPELKNLTSGRWHLDSLRAQLKVFLFLSDTTEKSGPFEFLPRSHNPLFKIRNIGKYVRVSDLVGMIKKRGDRSYSKLDDTWVEGLSHKGFNAKPVICKAGTIMFVNTTAIHRARPCLEGSRYALTTYF